MTVYTRRLLSRDYLVLRAYPFRDDAVTLGHSHLADFDIETPFRVHGCDFSMDHGVIDTLGSVSSAYLV